MNHYQRDGGKESLVKRRKQLWKLFTSTFKLSACTFGGGFVIIPLMRKKFVEEKGWIEEQEMLDFTAIAQSTPGAIAVNASILVGFHVGGTVGAVVAVLGTVLPPLIIISVISLFYQAFRDNVYVNRMMAGMLCGVAAVIFDVVINMIEGITGQKRKLPVIVMIGAFLAVRFFKINIVFIIFVCGIVGALDIYWRSQKERGEC